jgi:hypothetical protein
MATIDDLARGGIADLNERRYEDALAKFREALALDDSRPDLHNLMGTALLRRGEVGEALPALERAFALSEPITVDAAQPMKLHIHLGLANTYELLERIGDAVRTLEKASREWPEKTEPKLQLAQLLLGSCHLDRGVALYRELAEHPGLDPDARKAAGAVVDAVRAFRESENPAKIFVQAHAESYRNYFDEAVQDSIATGWYAEAARMARDKSGEVKPLLPEGARPYAMQRVDLVNPADGSVASVYSEQEPMIVALNGLEPLAQLAITFPGDGYPFETWFSSRAPWHWLAISVQFATEADSDARIDDLDPIVGDWYLAGFNGEFGDRESGRFHFITDPDAFDARSVSYTVDLGRARFDAIDALLRRLAVLHEKRPLRRVLFGHGHLPD